MMKATLRHGAKEIWVGTDYADKDERDKWMKVYEVVMQFETERAARDFMDYLKRAGWQNDD